MKEVRWVNNMYAWERARNAKKEVGEVRPTTLLLGRPGQERNWDEWSSIGTGESSSGSGRHVGIGCLMCTRTSADFIDVGCG